MSNPHLERLQLLRPFAGRLAAGMMFMLAAVAIQLAYPKALAYFIDLLTSAGAAAWNPALGWLAVAMAVLQALATTMRYYLFESTGHMVVARIRRQLYQALIRQPIAFHDRHNVGELTSRLAADVAILHETLTMGLAIFLRCACVFVGGAVMLLSISPALSMVLLGFVPLNLYLSRRAGRNYRTRAQQIQDSLAGSAKVAHEHFSHIRLVHALSQYGTAIRRYARATDHALSVALSSVRLFAAYRGVSSLLMLLTLAAALWLGAGMIARGELSVGELTAFVLYAGMVTEAVGAIGEFWNKWMRTLGATDRVFSMIRAAPVAQSAMPAPATALALRGAVALQDVVFTYPERPGITALGGVSFTIGAGEKVALVGPSGAGKSTIASLLLGLYQPTQGRIRFDDIDAASVDINALRANIAIVEQEPALFSGTIFENIAFAVSDRDVTLEEAVTAARLACADDFISAFPDGYHTVVGERGMQLSGGQKQRIAIARALLRNPRILILDEATSALDAASEAQVQLALERLMAGRTTISIAHRYSTIVGADRIVVMERGCVVQQGAHGALIADTNGLYFALMHKQLMGAGAGEV